MPGVLSTKYKGGYYRGWYKDFHNNRIFFKGSKSKAETLKIATKLEDQNRLISLGYNPTPHQSEKFKNKIIAAVLEEYFRWGNIKGGRKNKPWGYHTFRIKKIRLNFWIQKLNLKTLNDLKDIFTSVKKQLEQFEDSDIAGRTCKGYYEDIKSFCSWCVSENYLKENPLNNKLNFNLTPKSTRRAWTMEEFQNLIQVAPYHRQLLYETALFSGLRKNELKSLTTFHLTDAGLRLEEDWTKNRNNDIQPLPFDLIKKLKKAVEKNMAKKLYNKFSPQKIRLKEPPPENPLLFVPTQVDKCIRKDIERASIIRKDFEGKLDFHAFRNAYITFIDGLGASVKEARTLARHNSDLTHSLYAKVRNQRLRNLIEEFYSMSKFNQLNNSDPINNYLEVKKIS